MFVRFPRAVAIAAVFWLSAGQFAPAADDLFAPVASILERKCVNCHNAGEKKGGLSFETAASFTLGGESGATVAAGDPDSSLLIDYVSGDKPQMPKRGEALTAAEVTSLKAWIEAG